MGILIELKERSLPLFIFLKEFRPEISNKGKKETKQNSANENICKDIQKTRSITDAKIPCKNKMDTCNNPKSSTNLSDLFRLGNLGYTGGHPYTKKYCNERWPKNKTDNNPCGQS